MSRHKIDVSFSDAENTVDYLWRLGERERERERHTHTHTHTHTHSEKETDRQREGGGGGTLLGFLDGNKATHHILFLFPR